MPTKGIEQLSLSRLINVTVDDFDLSLKGWKFSMLALHSRVEPGNLVRLLSKNRKLSLFDHRRRLTDGEESKRSFLEELAEESAEYSKWIWDRDFQPLLRDLLVGQCVAFENFLKTIGVASSLSSTAPYSLDRLIFVPSDEFRSKHKTVNRWWKDSNATQRVSNFLERYVIHNQPIIGTYSGWRRVGISAWGSIWDEIFVLRNAIVHSRARPVEQIQIGDEVFSPFDEANISEHTLREIDRAFRVVVNAFRLSMDDL